MLTAQQFTRGPRAEPRFPTVTSAFYYHARAQPQAVATRDLSFSPPHEITYGFLAQRAADLAARLGQAGVVPGDRVPLVMKRGIDMIVAILATLSCGAQYVPMDGGVVPEATLRFVLQQTEAKTVLCLRATKHRLAGLVESDKAVEVDAEARDGGHVVSFPDLARPEHGCYIIYTSGKAISKDDESWTFAEWGSRNHGHAQGC